MLCRMIDVEKMKEILNELKLTDERGEKEFGILLQMTNFGDVEISDDDMNFNEEVKAEENNESQEESKDKNIKEDLRNKLKEIEEFSSVNEVLKELYNQNQITPSDLKA